jgi:hypothetical protein
VIAKQEERKSQENRNKTETLLAWLDQIPIMRAPLTG